MLTIWNMNPIFFFFESPNFGGQLRGEGGGGGGGENQTFWEATYRNVGEIYTACLLSRTFSV